MELDRVRLQAGRLGRPRLVATGPGTALPATDGLQRLAELLEEVEVASGAAVVTEGEAADAFYRARLPAVREIDLQGCESLPSLPLVLSWPCLRRIMLRGCKRLVELPSLERLTQLESMHLGDLPRLTSLPPSIGQLRRLRFVNLGYCTSLTALPNLSNLTALTDLYLHSCDALKALPEGLTGKALRTYAVPVHLKQNPEDALASGEPVGKLMPLRIGNAKVL